MIGARRGTLSAAALKLARLLGPEECVLVGGLAVGVHGVVRATDDLDFVSRNPLELTRRKLHRAGIETCLVRGDVLDAGFSCLKGEIDGIPFDVQPPVVPIAWDQAVTAEVAGGKLQVVDLDGLLQLKFRAQAAQDLLDAARLVLRHPETEARARELATAYRALDRFETCFRDQRTRAQAREEAELERGRPSSKPRSKRHGKRAAASAARHRPGGKARTLR